MKKDNKWSGKKWKDYKGKWGSKEEYDKVEEVRERYNKMAESRRTSYRGVGTSSGTNEFGSTAGSDWAVRWNKNEKMAKMWRETLEDRSNIKSSTSFAPLQALLAEFQENNTGISMYPTQSRDKSGVRVHYHVHENWENQRGIGSLKSDSFDDNITFGTSVPYIGWQRRIKKNVEIIKSLSRSRKEIERVVKEGEEKKESEIDQMLKESRPFVEKKDLIVYDDIVYIPTSIFEIYIDPDARCFSGPAYEAADIVWRQIPSVEQFKAQFINSTDSYVIKKNIKKVKGAYEAYKDYVGAEPFFRAPEDIQNNNKVELIRYYNQIKDEYIIIANDVLIRKGPLPYNHKELPFARHRFIKWTHQFYGIGLPEVLESVQAEAETLRNMRLDQAKIVVNPPILVNTEIMPDIEQGYDEVKAGLFVEVDGNISEQNIRTMRFAPIPFDVQQTENGLQEEAIKISGVNPMSYAFPRPNEPVRNNMMSQESTLKMLKKGIKNWADGEGYVRAVRQMVEIRKQMMPLSFIEEIDDQTGKIKKKYPTIRTEGIEIEKKPVDEELMVRMLEATGGDTESALQKYIEKGGKIELEEKKIEGTGYFEVLGEFLEVGQMDIQINVDTLVPVTVGFKMQQIQQAMSQLIPVLSNPELMQAPGVQELVREFIETHGLSDKLLDSLQNEDTDESGRVAYEQTEKMLKGESVVGVPGESDEHIAIHTAAMLDLINKSQDVSLSVLDMQNIEKAIGLLAMHLQTDMTPKPMASQMALSEAKPPEPQNPQVPPEGVAPPQGGMPMPQGGEMGGMPPMM